MKYWKGEYITKLEANEVFVFGANPEARHFAGAAKAALKMGAIPKNGNKPGIARGLSPNQQTYALITKNLTAGVVENGITYDKEGFQSVSPDQIRANIDEMYEVAKKFPEKSFLITYQYEIWPNGTPKKSLNGYDSQEMFEMFCKDKEIPPNIVFHESYKPHLEKLLKNKTANTNNENKEISTQSIPTNKQQLIVLGYRDKAPDGYTVINTTSRDESGFGREFSPFILSNIPLYEGLISKNMENAWQFSKVYQEFADENNNPSQKYFDWAAKGWNDSFAHRYANGKGSIPLYSYWKKYDVTTNKWIEHRYDYITARKNIYFPLYAKAIIKTDAFQELKQRLADGEKIALLDFDGYDHAARNMTYEDVVNSEKYKCGHAFVVYGLITEQLKLINNQLYFDFDLKLTKDDILEIQNKEEQSLLFNAISPFSDIYPSKIKYKEYDFISNEQFVLFSKAKTFKDENVAYKIIDINNNELAKKFISGELSSLDIITNNILLEQWNHLMSQIKQFSNEIQNYSDELWNEKQIKITRFGLKEKFYQNQDLTNILLNIDLSILTDNFSNINNKTLTIKKNLIDVYEFLKSQNNSSLKKNNKP